ncbi:MAG: DJ-1/PfpI family protein [Alphaproteobacteria bacterium]
MEKALDGKKIAILIANGFDEVSMTTIQKMLLTAGASVKITSPENNLVQGWHGSGWGHYFPVDVHLSDMLSVDYDMAFLPGGARGVEKLMANPHTRRIVSTFIDAAKPVAAWAEGVQLLVTANRIAKRQCAVLETNRAMLQEAGAVCVEEAIVQDGFLLTAGQDAVMSEFSQKLMELFCSYQPISVAA